MMINFSAKIDNFSQMCNFFSRFSRFYPLITAKKQNFASFPANSPSSRVLPAAPSSAAAPGLGAALGLGAAPSLGAAPGLGAALGSGAKVQSPATLLWGLTPATTAHQTLLRGLPPATMSEELTDAGGWTFAVYSHYNRGHF